MRARLSVGLRHMALASFYFSVMAVFAKLAGRHLPTAELVAARTIVTFVVTWVALRRLGISPLGTHRRLLVLRGLAGLGGLTCYFYALTQLPIADATVLQYTNPLFTAWLAALFLRERLRLVDAIGSAVSLTGIVLVARPAFLFGDGTSLDSFAVLIALLGAIFSSFVYVLIRRTGTREHPLVIVFYFPLVSIPFVVPAVLVDPVVPTALEWVFLLALGLCAQLGQIHMTEGLQREPAGKATAVMYLQVALGYLWGLAVFADRLDPLGIMGALLVLGGIWIVSAAARA